MRVGQDRSFLGRGIAGALEDGVIGGGALQQLFRARHARDLFGRGACDNNGIAHRAVLERKGHGDAERRPIVGGARGHLHVGGLARAERRHRHRGDKLVLLQHGLVIAGVKLFQRQFAGAVRPGDRDPRAERGQHRRQIHMRIAMRQRAADAGDIAHARIGEPPQRRV